MSDAKDAIIARLKEGLRHSNPKPYPSIDEEVASVFARQDDYWDVLFAENFKRQGGTFFYCEDAEKMVEQLAALTTLKRWQHVHCWDSTLLELFQICSFDLAKDSYPTQLNTVGITTCHGLIARSGSILMSSRQSGGRILSLLPMVHIVIATTKQLFYDFNQAFKQISTQLPAMLSVVTGPSRTADIEKTLVLGAHAPKELYLFLIEN